MNKQPEPTLSGGLSSLLRQDLGTLAMLGALLGGSLLAALTPERETEYLLLLLACFLLVVLVSFRLTSVATVFAGLTVAGYLFFRIYRVSSAGEAILPTDYLWLFLPPFALGGTALFFHASAGTERENTLLRAQLEELSMLDALTGLYNLRGLYNDLERNMSLSSRTGTPLTLLLLRPRYGDELRSILSHSHYDRMLQRLAELTESHLRLEDRVYAVDGKGTLAVLLTTDREGARIVERRLRAGIAQTEAFAGIADRPIKVEITMGACAYDRESIHTAMEWKQRTESELQYDV